MSPTRWRLYISLRTGLEYTACWAIGSRVISNEADGGDGAKGAEGAKGADGAEGADG